MADLGNYTKTSEILKKYQFRMQKKYGQNFLIDGNILAKIVEAAQITKEDCVLEIGPGIGCLTRELCHRAGKVVSVELDPSLQPVLAETMAGEDNFVLVSGDVLKLDIGRLVEEHFQGLTPLVCANLPYNAATPILHALVESGRFEALTVTGPAGGCPASCRKAGDRGLWGAVGVYAVSHPAGAAF